MPTVFINYRRQDSDAYAGRLYDTLTMRLPDLHVFMDVSGVKGGDDFTKVLEKTLLGTDVMLAVVGPTWVTAAKPDGTRRLNDPDDFVIMEIAEALKRNVAVLPVLVQDAAMPSAVELPPRIRDLAKRQAMSMSNTSWNADANALIGRIELLVSEGTIRTSADGTLTPDAPPWKGALQRLQVRCDRLRRRVIPRSRTWRLVRSAAAVIGVAALLVGGYASVVYVRGAEQRGIERVAADLRYEKPLEVVTGAIAALRELALGSSNPEVTHLVVARLKGLVLVRTDTTDEGRAIRKRALETIKTLRQNNLTIDFAESDLKEADLVDVDLSRTVLKGLSFEDAFLIRTNFSATDLSGVNLSGAWVRNADFAAATITGANVEGLDWFNAEGFAPDQLRAVDLSTLAPCPKDDSHRTTEAAFRSRLAKEYDFQWEQLGSDRSQLLSFWAHYANSGGLCAQVDSWLATLERP